MRAASRPPSAPNPASQGISSQSYTANPKEGQALNGKPHHQQQLERHPLETTYRIIVGIGMFPLLNVPNATDRPELCRFEILLAIDFLGCATTAGSGLTASVKVSFVGGGEMILKIL